MLQMGYRIVIYVLAVLTVVTGISIFVLYSGYSRKPANAVEAGPESEDDAASENTVSQMIPRLSEVVDVVEVKEDNRKDISLLLSSIQKDIKIKILDEKGNLIKGIAWEAAITGNSGEQMGYRDDNKDGIIYAPGLSSGEYQVSLETVPNYRVPVEGTKVRVKDHIEYRVIANIRDEIKTEDEIDVKLEDTLNEEEIDKGPVRKDTVAFVPSKKTLVESASGEEYLYNGWQTREGKTYYYTAEGSYVTGEQVINGIVYEFQKDGSLTRDSGAFGIDVSKWNKEIDWTRVKEAGVQYAIIRIGYRGSSTGALVADPLFERNLEGARQAGVPVGIYFFTQALTEAEAVEEASMVAALLEGRTLDYPIFLDVEGSGGRADVLEPAERTNNILAFLETIENQGYSAGVYANKNWLTNRIDAGRLTAYHIWLAQYNKSEPDYEGRYDIWQYSSKGNIDGISGYTDMNIDFTDSKE